MMSARLIHRGWLLRVIEIALADARHLVVYDGRGIGYEQVSVDGGVILKSSWLWFVPRFEFSLGGRPGVVEVRVWPWLVLRSLVVRVGDQVIYEEGTGLRKQAQGAVPSDGGETSEGVTGCDG